jgi:catalase
MGCRIFGLGLAACVAIAASALAEDEPDGEQLVEALNAVFGKHPHMRASHAKGICVKGRFTPAPNASSLSMARHYAEVPVLARFSLGGGNPKAADNAKGARGLAIRFDPDDDYSDMVLLSVPIFFARTPGQVIEFLRVRAPGPDGSAADLEKIKAFGEEFPETTKQGAWIAERPVPASYATANYWGIHAFTLTNAAGDTKTVKFKMIPAGGEASLSDEEAKEKGVDFYADELEERLGKAPLQFELVAMMGQDGDSTDDPTVLWEEEGRETAPLGT